MQLIVDDKDSILRHYIPKGFFHRKTDGTSVDPSYRETAIYYCVDDMPGATIPSSRLQKILASLQSGKSVTQLSLTYLRQQNLSALHRFVQGELTYDAFRDLALIERSKRERVEIARVARQASEAEQRAREAEQRAREVEATRRAREKDPAYIAKINNQKLRARYGIDIFIEQQFFSRLMKILKSVDSGQRLSEEDFIWLSTAAEEYFSNELRAAYHQLEAEFFASEFSQTRNPWKAVNASSHYRKCDQAGKAKALLDTINVDHQKSPKLKSAFYTTRGGVMRDLSRWDEALRLGVDQAVVSPAAISITAGRAGCSYRDRTDHTG